MLSQIIFSIFIIFAIIRVAGKYRLREIALSEFVFWFFFWLAAGVAFWLPDFITQLANLLGIGRGADLVLYAGIIIIFYLIFRIYIRLEKMERNITKIVRKEALDEKNDV